MAITPKKVKVDSELRLEGFPDVYFINLDDSFDRLENLQKQFARYNICNTKRMSAKRITSREEKEVHIAIRTSHLSALKCFMEDNQSRYAVICEDDVNLTLSEKWKFNWSHVMRRIEENQINILQLSLIAASPELILTGFHKRRPGIDWSSAIYIVSHQGAKEILLKSMDESRLTGVTESDLFDDLEVFSWPLFDCSADLGSTFHSDHIDRYHKPSFNFLRNSFDSCES